MSCQLSTCLSCHCPTNRFRYNHSEVDIQNAEHGSGTPERGIYNIGETRFPIALLVNSIHCTTTKNSSLNYQILRT